MYEHFTSQLREKQLASLIASNNIQNVMKPQIDKLTLLFDFRYPEKNISTICKHNDYISEHPSKNRRLGYQYTLETASGLHIDIAPFKHKTLQNCRIEFNPNKFNPVDTLFHTLLLCAKNIRISRIDYNIDYPIDLSIYQWQTEKARTQVLFVSPTNQLETLYLGKSSSADFYRIYDKAAELRKTQPEQLQPTTPLWRIEHVFKLDTKTSTRQIKPFNSLYGWTPDTFTGDYHDDLILRDLHANPTNFNRLSTRKRASYRQMMKDHKRTVHPQEHPEKIYLTHCQPLHDFLYHLTTRTPLS